MPIYKPEADNTRMDHQNPLTLQQAMQQEPVQTLSPIDDIGRQTYEYEQKSKPSLTAKILQTPMLGIKSAFDLDPGLLFDEQKRQDWYENATISDALKLSAAVVGTDLAGAAAVKGFSAIAKSTVGKIIKTRIAKKVAELGEKYLPSAAKKEEQVYRLMREGVDSHIDELSSEEGRRRMQAFKERYGENIEQRFNKLTEKHEQNIHTDIKDKVSNVDRIGFNIEEPSSILNDDWYAAAQSSWPYLQATNSKYALNNTLGEIALNKKHISDFINADKLEIENTMGHEFDHLADIVIPTPNKSFNIFRPFNSNTQWEDDIDNIFYNVSDQQSIFRKKNMSFEKVDYYTTQTEEKSYLFNDLRTRLKKMGLIKNRYDKITPEMLETAKENVIKQSTSKRPPCCEEVYLLNMKPGKAKELAALYNKYFYSAAGIGIAAKSLQSNNK